MSPSVFEQLYVILSHLGDSAVSWLYRFLSGKSTQIYQDLLQAVLDKMETMQTYTDPRVIISDFELAANQSVDVVLGLQVTTQGCFYHLSQSTWKKILSEQRRFFSSHLDNLS